MRNVICALCALLVAVSLGCSPELHEVDERTFPVVSEPVAPEPEPASPPAPEQTKLPEPPPPPPPPPPMTKPPLTTDLFVPAWALNGPIIQTTAATYKVSPGFDFTKRAVVPAVFQTPITLPPEARDAKSITLTYEVKADATWGAPSSWCASQLGFSDRVLVEQGTDHACLQPGAKAGLVIDGAFTGRNAGTLSTLVLAPPAGTTYPVTTSSTVWLRLEVVGDVELSNVVGTVTATLTF